MTDTTPDYPPSRCEDKHGNELHDGDTVEFAYGGQHHRMVIAGKRHDRAWLIEGTIHVTVHAAGATRVHTHVHVPHQSSSTTTQPTDQQVARPSLAAPSPSPATKSTTKGRK